MIQKKLSRYYISLEGAAKLCNYSQEYLSLRARHGKLKAKKIGRNWVTTEEWLKNYIAKAEEYNGRFNGDIEVQKSLSVGPAGRDKNLKLIFATAIISVLLIAGFFLVGQAPIRVGKIIDYNSSVFKDYGQWLGEKTQLNVLGREFSGFAGWVKEKISNFAQKPSLTKEDLIEIEEKQTKTIIEKFQEEIQGLRVKEIIKEIKRVTEVTPVKEITREITKVDEEALKKVREDIAYLESEMAKRLYAPGGVITQQIYIKEPIQSPKIYQENGEIVLQTLGSGNVILSAATGLHLYGSQVVIKSTSLLNPLVSILSPTRIEGNLTVTGNISGNGISGSTLTLSGNANVGGNFTVLGDLTVSGALNYSGVLSLAASSTSPVLQVKQNGSGLVAQFLNSFNTSLFSIANDGSVIANATITAASFASAANNSTIRKSGEEVFREILPISRYDIPAQTGTATYFRISKSFDQNPLSSTPELLPGATRVYKLIIKYADNIPAHSSSSWRIYRPAAVETSDSFVLLGQNLDSVAEGIATTTQNLTIPNNDWQVDVKLSEADSGKTLRIFQIFLAAFDKIN